MRLVNRNNCVASKLTQIYYMYTPGPVCGGFPPHTGPACLRLAHGEKVILRMTR